MRPVFADVLNLGVNLLDALLLAAPLRHGQVIFVLAREVRTAVFDAIGAGDLVCQSQVNPHGVKRQGKLGSVRDVALQADVPASAGVLDKAPGVDLTLDGAREPQAKDAPEIDHGVFNQLDGAHLERDPAKGLLAAAPGQTRFADLLAGLGVLKTNLINRVAVQAQLFARAGTQIGQVIARQPLSVTAP